MSLILTVRYNKANDQKYVTIPRKSDVAIGAKVLVSVVDWNLLTEFPHASKAVAEVASKSNGKLNLQRREGIGSRDMLPVSPVGNGIGLSDPDDHTLDAIGLSKGSMEGVDVTTEQESVDGLKLTKLANDAKAPKRKTKADVDADTEKTLKVGNIPVKTPEELAKDLVADHKVIMSEANPDEIITPLPKKLRGKMEGADHVGYYEEDEPSVLAEAPASSLEGWNDTLKQVVEDKESYSTAEKKPKAEDADEDEPNPFCPKCHSENIQVSKSGGGNRCKDCNHKWE